MSVFFRVFEAVLDAILPRHSRSVRTNARSVEAIPLSPISHELLGVTITTLADYREKPVQDLIQSLKYDRSRHAAKLVALFLADYLREEIAAHRAFSTKEILIVPVPLHHKRARERGFNQIALVLGSLPREFRNGTLATLAPEAIERVRETRPQTHLKRAERLENVRDAFAAKNPDRLARARILLIDDVTTTGATLKYAGDALKEAGGEVELLALARA